MSTKVVQEGKAVLGLLMASAALPGLHSNNSPRLLGQSPRYGSESRRVVVPHMEMPVWALGMVLMAVHTRSPGEKDTHRPWQLVDTVQKFAHMYSLRVHMMQTPLVPVLPGRRGLQAASVASVAVVAPGPRNHNTDATGASRIEYNQL